MVESVFCWLEQKQFFGYLWYLMDAIDLINEGKIKRFFRATRKLNIPKFVYHITQRAAGSEPLFLEDKDNLFMLGLLKQVSSKYSLQMYAFCLMPNHVHLLFSPREENLYDAMRDLFSRYAMKFNRKYERKGHLFGGPYRQAVCLDDTYLLAASLYIHLNPVKAGLAKDPIDYRWSSCRLYWDDDALKSFINPNFVLNMLSKGKVEKKQRYRSLLRKGKEIHFGHVLENEGAIEKFQSTLTSIFPAVLSWVGNKNLMSRHAGTNLLGMEEVERMMENLSNMPFPDKPETRKAKKYLIEQLIARGYRRAEIADRLSVSRKTVYNILKSHS